MKKIIFMGKSGSGKTTLIEALRGEKLVYRKTQCIDYSDHFMDTPGEYAEGNDLGGALAVYSYEADVVGILVAANEPYSLFPPNVTSQANRECVGIVTKIDKKDGNAELAASWLRNAGCKNIFYVNSKTGEGVSDILEYLREPGDVMPWERQDSNC